MARGMTHWCGFPYSASEGILGNNSYGESLSELHTNVGQVHKYNRISLQHNCWYTRS